MQISRPRHSSTVFSRPPAEGIARSFVTVPRPAGHLMTHSLAAKVLLATVVAFGGACSPAESGPPEGSGGRASGGTTGTGGGSGGTLGTGGATGGEATGGQTAAGTGGNAGTPEQTGGPSGNGGAATGGRSSGGVGGMTVTGGSTGSGGVSATRTSTSRAGCRTTSSTWPSRTGRFPSIWRRNMKRISSTRRKSC